MVVLTDRQKGILMAIVEEFMDTHQEVGSAYLVRTRGLNISPATVRNEMVKLMALGYLDKSHTSSGRIPTDEAIKLYVSEQLDSMLDTIDEVLIKKEITKYRYEKQKFADEILKQLSDYVKSMSFIFWDDTQKYYGMSYLLQYLELRDVDLLDTITKLIDDTTVLRAILNRANNTFSENDVKILIGGDLGLGKVDECAVVFVSTPFWDGQECTIGVFGSKRLNYRKAVPALRLIKDTISMILRGWN